MFNKAIRKFIYGYINKESEKFAWGSDPWKACLLVCKILDGTYKYK